MITLSLKKVVVVAVSGGALALTAGAGISSADPLVDTTCSYQQVMAALNAENPALAQKFASNPLAASTLSRFLASGPAERQQMVQQLSSSSWAQKYMGPIASIAAVCNNY